LQSVEHPPAAASDEVELVGAAPAPPAGRCDGAGRVLATVGLQLEPVRAAQRRGTRVEVWFQDEARIGQKNSLTRVSGQTGSRPVAPKDLGFASAYLFGAVCPSQGKPALAKAGGGGMNHHLGEIGSQVAADAHAVVILDGASWHNSHGLMVPSNITLLALPPYSYLFAGSDAGGRRAAAIYSLIESAKLNALNPSTTSPTCSPASPIIRRGALPNSCPGTGNRSTPPALPPKPAHSPSAYRQAVAVTKENTTLYASDRDRFVFLADEGNRIELPNRRTGRFGSFARGFFVWNSEVGKTTLGAGFFLFDYVCCNRIIWGADQYTEVHIRHTKGAPDRWLDEVTPVLRDYSQASAKPVVQALEDARSKRIDDELTTFLAKRFGKAAAPAIMAVHEQEEDRPIETLWDVTVAATAFARSRMNTDKRLEIERTAGELLKLAA
jgi:hypothetical protein